MTNIEKIDYAIKETLKVHPDYCNNLALSMYKNTMEEIKTVNFTRNNYAREHITGLTKTDFMEYIIKNAIAIFCAKDEVLGQDAEKRVVYKQENAISELNFPGYNIIFEEIINILNPNVNAFSYFEMRPNNFFYLTQAVMDIRFNRRFYYPLNNASLDDCMRMGDEFRARIANVNNTQKEKLNAKINNDYQKLSCVSNLQVNGYNLNKCYEAVMDNTQVKYNHNNYGLGQELYASQDVGKRKSNQEDSTIIMEHPDNNNFKFLAVADGVGGLNQGEVASNFAISQISKWFDGLDKELYNNPEELLDEFKIALYNINKSIYNQFHGKALTTFVGAIVTENETIIVNIGDSRGYTVKDNMISLVTRDDSIVWALMNYETNGQYSMQDIENLRFNRDNNVITNSLGNPDFNKINITSVPNDYDKLLLFSDGVTDILSSRDILFICQTTPRNEITEAIISKANEKNITNGEVVVRGGKDNATVAMYSPMQGKGR